MKYVPFSIIQAAQRYDSEAADFIQQHFADYIEYKALSPFIDSHGGLHMRPDDDLCYEAEKALFAAMKGFQFQEPPDSFPS